MVDKEITAYGGFIAIREQQTAINPFHIISFTETPKTSWLFKQDGTFNVTARLRNGNSVTIENIRGFEFAALVRQAKLQQLQCADYDYSEYGSGSLVPQAKEGFVNIQDPTPLNGGFSGSKNFDPSEVIQVTFVRKSGQTGNDNPKCLFNVDTTVDRETVKVDFVNNIYGFLNACAVAFVQKLPPAQGVQTQPPSAPAKGSTVPTTTAIAAA
jgi:hypothetical protein